MVLVSFSDPFRVSKSPSCAERLLCPRWTECLTINTWPDFQRYWKVTEARFAKGWFDKNMISQTHINKTHSSQSCWLPKLETNNNLSITQRKMQTRQKLFSKAALLSKESDRHKQGYWAHRGQKDSPSFTSDLGGISSHWWEVDLTIWHNWSISTEEGRFKKYESLQGPFLLFLI